MKFLVCSFSEIWVEKTEKLKTNFFSRLSWTVTVAMQGTENRFSMKWFLATDMEEKEFERQKTVKTKSIFGFSNYLKSNVWKKLRPSKKKFIYNLNHVAQDHYLRIPIGRLEKHELETWDITKLKTVRDNFPYFGFLRKKPKNETFNQIFPKRWKLSTGVVVGRQLRWNIMWIVQIKHEL